jgi:hypothetical protein
MALISSVTTSETKGREGMLSTTNPLDGMVIKRASATQLYFGRAVIIGASDPFVVHPSGSAGSFFGIVIEDLSIHPLLLSGAGDIPVGYDAQILRRGRIWVVPEQDVVTTDPVFYRHANSTPDADPAALGRFRKDADTADATALTNARWVTSGLAGTIAELEINLP